MSAWARGVDAHDGNGARRNLRRGRALPDGVVNVVHGFGKDSAGEAIAKHPGIGVVAFTGETTTGKAIMQAASGNLKKRCHSSWGKESQHRILGLLHR